MSTYKYVKMGGAVWVIGIFCIFISLYLLLNNVVLSNATEIVAEFVGSLIFGSLAFICIAEAIKFRVAYDDKTIIYDSAVYKNNKQRWSNLVNVIPSSRENYYLTLEFRDNSRMRIFIYSRGIAELVNILKNKGYETQYA